MQTEKKSSHCVIACTCMADYSIPHDRVCYLYKKCWVMGLCRPSDITTINMSQSCVKLYECTKFGTNIVGETCTNSVTWFCAYLCKRVKTQWTMHVVISDVQHAAFYYLCQQISPKVLKFLSFAFKHCAHSKNTTSFNVSSTLFSTPFVLFSCTPFGTKSYKYKWYWYNSSSK